MANQLEEFQFNYETVRLGSPIHKGLEALLESIGIDLDRVTWDTIFLDVDGANVVFPYDDKFKAEYVPEEELNTLLEIIALEEGTD